uniref:Si:dkey-283b15.2 n=1 Tax=Amphiprion percula TaxID=161767 RepID=A0A3P8S9I4_AMPPE
MEVILRTSSLLLLLFSLLLRPSSSSSGFDQAAQPRFLCTPVPVDADPSCFPAAAGHQSAPPAGWWGASEEAKATILALRESLVQQKETILDQRETIRELNAKLGLCEGFGHDRLHAAPPHHGAFPDDGRHGNQKGHHGNLIPDAPTHYSGPRADAGNQRTKEKQPTTAGDISSSPEQMERMLQALKERLDNLQKRNSSTTYSSSLKELLQRKISALEDQLHHHSATLSDPGHHGDDGDHQDHHDDDGHHDGHHDDHHEDEHHDNHQGDHDDGHHDDHQGDHDDGHHDDDDGEHHDDHSDHYDDSRNDDHHDTDGDPDNGHRHDDDSADHHSNEVDSSHSYLPHTGYRTSGPRSNKLETMLNQLYLTGSSRKKPQSPDAFQISFPMRTNYMYGRLKRTLLQEIFALTLCLWMKAGAGPGLGTPFSYSAPGQSNELVLIEWGNNPLELLIDDQTVTLPLSLSDGKWHHICVSWSTRDGHWEAYQDGVQRGSGTNLAPWHPIRPGGVFILGQEQDTLGGRFDATQSFVGEMSDLHMWSHVLSAADIYDLASCGSHLRGDIIAWAESEVELHGGVARYPFDPCH